eukprot:Selendium_serpulae@DN10159_c0_g1_i1.p1
MDEIDYNSLQEQFSGPDNESELYPGRFTQASAFDYPLQSSNLGGLTAEEISIDDANGFRPGGAQFETGTRAPRQPAVGSKKSDADAAGKTASEGLADAPE